MSEGQEHRQLPRPLQLLWYYYTRSEFHDVAIILQENPSFLSSLSKLDDRCNYVKHGRKANSDEFLSNLADTLTEFSDVFIINWLLGFEELDLNFVYNVLDQQMKPLKFEITGLEQMLVFKFSMESILLVLRSGRLCPDTLHKATLRTVPHVSFHSAGYGCQRNKAFIDYVGTHVTGDLARLFLTEYLNNIDVNTQLPDYISNDRKTLLMLISSEMTIRTLSEGHCILLSVILNKPELDVNLVDNDGWPALFYVANCSATNLNLKLEVIDKLIHHFNANLNIRAKKGATILTHFIDRYMWVLEQSVRQQVQLSEDRYCHADVILEHLLTNANLDDDIQAPTVMHFLTHRVFLSLEVRQQQQWFDTYRVRLAKSCNDVLSLLLNLKSVDVNYQEKTSKRTALMVAIENDLPVHSFMREDLVKNILKHPHIDLTLTDSEGKTPLMYAIAHADPMLVHMIVSSRHNCSINKEDNNERTALRQALHLPPGEQRTNIIACLTKHPEIDDLNLQDPQGKTALQILLDNKRLTDIKSTLNNERSSREPILFDIVDNNHRNFLHCLLMTYNGDDSVETRSHIEQILRQILSIKHVNVNAAFRHNRTLLHLCVLEKAPKLVKIVLSTPSVDVNSKDSNDYTPLMHAVTLMHTECVSALLMNPACDVTIKNNNGEDVHDIVTNMGTEDTQVFNIINIVYQRCTQTSEYSIMSNISLDDQFKFLIRAIQSEKHVPPKLKEEAVTQISCIQNDISLHTDGRYGTPGGMAEDHRRKLQALRGYLCEEVMPRELFAHLMADSVLTDDLVEDISAQQTRRRMCERLMAVLPLRGPRAFDSFISALTAEGQEHVAKTILEYDPDDKLQETGSMSESVNMKSSVESYGGLHEPYAVVPLRFMLPQYAQWPIAHNDNNHSRISGVHTSHLNPLDYNFNQSEIMSTEYMKPRRLFKRIPDTNSEFLSTEYMKPNEPLRPHTNELDPEREAELLKVQTNRSTKPNDIQQACISNRLDRNSETITSETQYLKPVVNGTQGTELKLASVSPDLTSETNVLKAPSPPATSLQLWGSEGTKQVEVADGTVKSKHQKRSRTLSLNDIKI